MKEVCIKLKQDLESKGFHTFVKTSGGKGLHIFIPIKPNVTTEHVKDKSKILAEEFVKKYPSIATLQLPKKKRTSKILIDIYRNALLSTVISPYSLRGKPGAPVSMPLKRDQLESLQTSLDFSIKNVYELIQKIGDPWQKMYDYAFDLKAKKSNPINLDDIDPPENLKQYFEKRDFLITPEPKDHYQISRSDRFVIHRHFASKLHFDLRLESNGALKSWAISKGLPFRIGEKRLAVQTEDHPISYLYFNGTIPKGQYGAGERDILATGTFAWLERTESSHSFKLQTKLWERTYLMYQTHNQNWIIESRNVTLPQPNLPQYDHMLAEQVIDIPEGNGWQYEVKWDQSLFNSE